ncbi:hypothetical protein HHI36_011036 [Cryptolaemus montrouzieri]|uniref:Phosphatidylethanolamine-binding protein n=1 Tax=Cryptolaemus montrouzieri TaxID=559131 RepID=A0ABD2MKJ8_9CUCU
MEKHEIIPDVIKMAPKEILEINYPSGVKAELGNILTPTQVKDMPKLKWTADSNELYTLCMTDPDAPSREKPHIREWHHWLVGNIPGNDVMNGETLTGFVGSGPPKGTGLHRYVFLVYKQPKRITFNEGRIPNTTGDNRGCFSIRKFASKYNLGEPIAGNFYRAEWDDYVPTLYKQLNL